MASNKYLIIGAAGQVGTELVSFLRQKHKSEQIIAADISDEDFDGKDEGPFEHIDILDIDRLHAIFKKHQPSRVYHLASLLSAKSELNPKLAWRVNMDGLLNIMDTAIEYEVKQLFWPSSIAVFGPNSPKLDTPQFTTMDPDTIYGISKLAGERWCHYYHFQKGLDVRSLRFPGLISYKHPPGGGTTDYAVDIFFKAVADKRYDCFLSEDTVLPMMYMQDAIYAIHNLMEAPAESLSVWSSYNITSMSFSPSQLAGEIKKYIPEFKITYNPDFRQRLADTWPESINDDFAIVDWGWKPKFNMKEMTKIMIENIREKDAIKS